MHDNKRRDRADSPEPKSFSVRLSKQHPTNVNKSKLESGGRFHGQNLTVRPENCYIWCFSVFTSFIFRILTFDEIHKHADN